MPKACTCFEEFSDEELQMLYALLRQYHGSYSGLTGVLGALLVELESRKFVRVDGVTYPHGDRRT